MKGGNQELNASHNSSRSASTASATAPAAPAASTASAAAPAPIASVDAHTNVTGERVLNARAPSFVPSKRTCVSTVSVGAALLKHLSDNFTDDEKNTLITLAVKAMQSGG